MQDSTYRQGRPQTSSAVFVRRRVWRSRKSTCSVLARRPYLPPSVMGLVSHCLRHRDAKNHDEIKHTSSAGAGSVRYIENRLPILCPAKVYQRLCAGTRNFFEGNNVTQSSLQRHGPRQRCRSREPYLLLLERKEVPYTNETMGTKARTPGVCVLGLNDIDSTVPG